MATRKLTLVLDLDTGQFSTRAKGATGQLRQLDTAVTRTNMSMGRANKSAQGFGATMRGVHHQLSFVHVVMAALTASVGGFTMALVKANAEAQRSVMLLEGLAKGATRASRQMEAAADFAFLRKMAKEVPFSMTTLTDAFVKLKSVGIDPTMGAMQALSDGMAMFGGSDAQFHRASIAIQQMMGKGVISMEELRQQLGEAFPIAIKTMARAAGMNVRDFVKQVSLGKVEAEKLLGSSGTFWTEMQREADGSAERMMQTWGGNISQIKTKLAELAFAIGGFDGTGNFTSGGFMSELTKGAKDFNAWLSDGDTIKGAQEFGAALAGIVLDLRGFIEFLASIAPQIKIAAGAFIAFKSVGYAQVALQGLVGMLGITTGAAGTVVSATTKMRLAQMAYHVEVMKGNGYTARSTAAIAAKAQAAAVAARTENTAIQSTVASLAKQKVAIESNILSLERQVIAASAAAKASQANAMAGFGNTYVGAGRDSVATGVGFNAKEALRQKAALAAAEANLARVTAAGTAANAAYAASTVTVAATSRAAEASLKGMTLASRAMTIATGAGTIAVRALNFAMAMLGGPVIAGLLLAFGALALIVKSNADRMERIKVAFEGADGAAARHERTLIELRSAYTVVNAVTGETLAQTDDFNTAMETRIGSVEGLSRALVILAEKARLANMVEIGTRIQANNRTIRQNQRVVSDEARETRYGVGNVMLRAVGAGALVNEGPSETSLAAQAIINRSEAENRVYAQEAAVTMRLGTKLFAAQQVDPADTGGGGGSTDTGGGGGAARQTPAQKLADDILALESGRASMDSLIDTMNLGSEAAEDMRVQIAEIRRGGGVITPEQEERAINAAQDAHNLTRAYDEVKGIFFSARDTAVAATEAFNDLGEGTNKVDISVGKYARTMAQARAEAVRLDPALAADTVRMAALDAVITDSIADHKFVQIAMSARRLHEEMTKLADTSLDPNLAVWDAYRAQITEINALVAQANSLPDDTEEDAQRKSEVLARLAADRSTYTARHVQETAFAMNEEITAIEEALMTTDQARLYQFNREVARIEALTDVSNLNAEDRAKYEVQMLALREAATAAAAERMARDLETPMEKMLRDYQDVNERMKALNADWLGDFMGMLRSGESNFGEFVLKILADYLMMLAEAKMAAMIDKGLDAIINIASAAMGVPTTGTTGGFDTGAGGFTTRGGGGSITGFHSGGIAGGTPTFSRTVSTAMFEDAKRYHTGGVIPGLRRGEVPIIAEEGEGIFTREQMAAMGGGGASGVAIEFNLINESGQDLQASEGGKSFDGEKYIIDVIVSNANRPGPLRSALRSSR